MSGRITSLRPVGPLDNIVRTGKKVYKLYRDAELLGEYLSYVAAEQAMNWSVTRSPTLADQYRIVPHFEEDIDR